jgi:hypothetical protein
MSSSWLNIDQYSDIHLMATLEFKMRDLLEITLLYDNKKSRVIHECKGQKATSVFVNLYKKMYTYVKRSRRLSKLTFLKCILRDSSMNMACKRIPYIVYDILKKGLSVVLAERQRCLYIIVNILHNDKQIASEVPSIIQIPSN